MLRGTANFLLLALCGQYHFLGAFGRAYIRRSDTGGGGNYYRKLKTYRNAFITGKLLLSLSRISVLSFGFHHGNASTSRISVKSVYTKSEECTFTRNKIIVPCACSYVSKSPTYAWNFGFVPVVKTMRKQVVGKYMLVPQLSSSEICDVKALF